MKHNLDRYQPDGPPPLALSTEKPRTFLDATAWALLQEDLHARPERDRFVHWPWTDLDDVYGPMLPGSLHVLAARTGGGKTTMMVNLIRRWVTGPEPTRVVYFPTETPALDIHLLLACLELGINPVPIKYHDYRQVPCRDEDPRYVFEQFVGEQMKFLSQYGAAGCPALAIVETPQPKLTILCEQVRAYAKLGAKIIILDHLLRLDDEGDGNFFKQVSNAVTRLSEIAQETGTVVLMTSQLGRDGGNRMAVFTVPMLESLKGSGAIEHEAHGVLFINAVKKDGLTKSEVEAVRDGFADMNSIRDPHLTRLTIAKHRVNGSLNGSKIHLWHDHGALSDLPDYARAAVEQAAHGIRS